MNTTLKSYNWTRSTNGILGGVCNGLADTLQAGVWIVRLLWLFSVFFLGTGILFYLILWIALPLESDPKQGLDKKIFGVCSRIGTRGDMHVGLARTIALTLLLISGGTAVIGYILLYFIIPNPKA